MGRGICFVWLEPPCTPYLVYFVETAARHTHKAISYTVGFVSRNKLVRLKPNSGFLSQSKKAVENSPFRLKPE